MHKLTKIVLILATVSGVEARPLNREKDDGFGEELMDFEDQYFQHVSDPEVSRESGY